MVHIYVIKLHHCVSSLNTTSLSIQGSCLTSLHNGEFKPCREFFCNFSHTVKIRVDFHLYSTVALEVPQPNCISSLNITFHQYKDIYPEQKFVNGLEHYLVKRDRYFSYISYTNINSSVLTLSITAFQYNGEKSSTPRRKSITFRIQVFFIQEYTDQNYYNT